jgi:hypothetical protein
MKWTLTSPDGIGDFLLRVPWLKEMERRGWQLQLVARPPTLEVAELAGINGDYIPIAVNPYGKEARRKKTPFSSEIARIVRYNPDIVFFGPSHPTFMEEELSQSLPGRKIGGFVLMDGVWMSESIADPLEISGRYDLKVPIGLEDAEAERNRKAAEMLLGRPVGISSWILKVTEGKLPPELADGGPFLVVNPSRREGDYFQGLGDEGWIRELSSLEQRVSERFVFVGTAPEAESNARIHTALPGRTRHLDLTGKLADLTRLSRIITASAGYVGKDCGVMHLATSMNKPIVAVFGGGHGRRFFPAGIRAAVLTVDVPCRGCDWRCHLPEPLCVRDLEHGCVAKAWESVRAMTGDGPLVVEQAMSAKGGEMILNHPQDDYPSKAHAHKRDQLRQERRQALAPLHQRILKRFLPKTCH